VNLAKPLMDRALSRRHFHILPVYGVYCVGRPRAAPSSYITTRCDLADTLFITAAGGSIDLLF
jgi:hypothetical protein